MDWSGAINIDLLRKLGVSTVCCIWLILGATAFCQQWKEEVDSLYARFGKQKKGLQYGEAVKTGVLLVEKGEEVFGRDHPNTAIFLNNLAVVYQAQGNYAEAEPLMLRAMAIEVKQLGVDHPSTARSLNNLSELYREQGRYAEAEPLCERALGIREKQLGADHPSTAISLNNLALLYYSQEKFGKAKPLYERALAIYEKQLGSDHPSTAHSLNNLAQLYRAQGEYAEAEPLYKRALAIHERQAGLDHPYTAASLNNLASLYMAQGEYAEAEPLYERSLAICEKRLGMDHPSTALSMSNLSGLYELQGKYAEAEPLVKRSLEGRNRHFARMLSYFSENDCIAMMEQDNSRNLVGRTLSGSNAALHQIWFKGAVQEGMNQRRIAEATLAGSEKGRGLLNQRKSFTSKYQASILRNGPGSEASASLKKQIDALDKQIAVLLKDRNMIAVSGVDLKEIRAALSQDMSLIETFRFGHELQDKSWEARYSSAVVSAEADPVYVSHLQAEVIEEAVKQYRISVTSPNEERSIQKRASSMREAERAFSANYLAPLEANLKPGQTVIFSLDSQLHFIPIHMIRDENGILFGARYRVRYVTSGRDLVRKTSEMRAKTAFVLGNPTFRDNAPMKALAEAEESASDDLTSNLRKGIGDDIGAMNLRPLPGTAHEIDQLGGKLKKIGYRVTSLSRKEATEESLKEQIEGTGIVHLATHGFFLNEIMLDQEPDRGGSMSGKEAFNLRTIQDPMYRGGLALAGAQSTFNLWKNGQVPPPSKDGILLAAEANLLNLRGTDLVVLSACETASGEALDGEGVMGLRRAFASAGANSTIMTLWPVNDESTVEVMDAFYDKYLNGTHPAIALAEVQNELYEPFVKKYGEVEAIARLAPFVCMSLGKVE